MPATERDASLRAMSSPYGADVCRTRALRDEDADTR